MILCEIPCAPDLALLCSILEREATAVCHIDILERDILHLAGNKARDLDRIARIDINSLEVADVDILDNSESAAKRVAVSIELLVSELVAPIDHILIPGCIPLVSIVLSGVRIGVDVRPVDIDRIGRDRPLELAAVSDRDILIVRCRSVAHGWERMVLARDVRKDILGVILADAVLRIYLLACRMAGNRIPAPVSDLDIYR